MNVIDENDINNSADGDWSNRQSFISPLPHMHQRNDLTSPPSLLQRKDEDEVSSPSIPEMITIERCSEFMIPELDLAKSPSFMIPALVADDDHDDNSSGHHGVTGSRVTSSNHLRYNSLWRTKFKLLPRPQTRAGIETYPQVGNSVRDEGSAMKKRRISFIPEK